MKNNSFDETFLAKWISGELTPDQLQEFKNQEDYEQYVKINKATEKLSFEYYDVDSAFKKVKDRVSKPKKSHVISIYKWAGAIAACIAIFVGVYISNFSDEVYVSGIAESKNVVLPDGSSVLLNATASAKFNEFKWDENRVVSLKGEAFFKVKKGDKFNVETTLGTIQVLGTQFTVNTIDNLLIVKCFEGKVKVSSGDTNVILNKGMAFQIRDTIVDNWVFDALEPNWVSANESTFKSVPITYVITSLQRQYGLKIENPEVLDNELIFTGAFTNKNLNKALYTVFEALGLKYEFVSEKEIRILH